MARKLIYKILDNGRNTIDDGAWEEIIRLQHWYNSEFVWTAGKLSLKMFAVFPNFDLEGTDEETLWSEIVRRRTELRSAGRSENQIVHQLETEGLVLVKGGGYFDDCIASGFTRVAANEFNAFLVCDFLLKVSHIAREATLTVSDEGAFIKPKTIRLHQGNLYLPAPAPEERMFFESMINHHHVFSVVDAAKYDHTQTFQSTITDFNTLSPEERHLIVKDWNWLGFENNFDINGDDIQGFDLNKKISGFFMENQ